MTSQVQRWFLPAVGIGLCVVAWKNSQNDAETQALSRFSVCASFETEGCAVAGGPPLDFSGDPVKRRYRWRTNLGELTSVCRRRFVFAGAWKCDSQGLAKARIKAEPSGDYPEGRRRPTKPLSSG